MLTPEMSRAARGLLGWTLSNLADAAGVSLMTISAFERGRPAYATTRAKLAEAFEREGIELILDETRIGAALVTVRRRRAPSPPGALARTDPDCETPGQEAAPVTGRPRPDLTDERP